MSSEDESPPPRSPRPWYHGAAFFPLVALALLFGSPLFARGAAGCGGYGEPVMEKLRSCDQVQLALGEQIDWASWGCASGQSRTGGGGGRANWKVPVAGTKASGSYGFIAVQQGGEWKLRRALLQVGDQSIDVLRCAPNAGPAFGSTVTRGARVSAAIGATPVPLGTRCQVQMGPADRKGGQPCRLIVDCGGQRLYGTGTSGYLDCYLDRGPGQGQPVLEDDEYTDKSGDPAVDLKVRSGQAILSDKGKDGIWTLTLQLDAPAP